jgi:hypothetical protein
MSAGVRAKILAASAYLDVAPTVVAVATSLPITDPGIPLHVLDPSEADAASALAERWNLGGSMTRAVAAVSNAALPTN